MYKLAALAAVAAAIALPTSLTTSAQAGTRVTVSPYYVPAVYCSYKSKEWDTEGHRLLPDWVGRRLASLARAGRSAGA